MIYVSHELAEEFPEAAQLIRRLRDCDPQFAGLAARYEDVNREINLIESGVTPTADDVLEDLKKQRLKYKDEIVASLRTTHG
jgi:uncharacterized protein YdcH (DUF465 family)